MIRCIRIWADADGGSVFEEGALALPSGTAGDAIGVPEGDRFQLLSGKQVGEIVYGEHYLGLTRSDGFVAILPERHSFRFPQPKEQ